MNYVLLVKTKIDNNIKHNSIEKIPYHIKGKFPWNLCTSFANASLLTLRISHSS